MTQAEINPHSMERFQNIPGACDAHHELLANPAFQRAEDMAVLFCNRAWSSNAAKSQNPQQEAMINGIKSLGVQEFLATFRGLAERPLEVLPPGRSRTLNHNA